MPVLRVRRCAAPFAALFLLRDALVRHLQMPLVPLVAVRRVPIGDGLHRRLRGYKDAPVAGGSGGLHPVAGRHAGGVAD